MMNFQNRRTRCNEYLDLSLKGYQGWVGSPGRGPNSSISGHDRQIL